MEGWSALPLPDCEPGSMCLVDVEGHPITLAHLPDGSWRAFDDTCTHEECSLSEGKLSGGEVLCPCHGSVFDINSGEALIGPAVDPVRVYEVRVVGSEVQLKV